MEQNQTYIWIPSPYFINCRTMRKWQHIQIPVSSLRKQDNHTYTSGVVLKIKWKCWVYWLIIFNVNGCCSIIQLFPALCDPMDYSTPGFPVLHHLLDLAQIHIHWVGDAIQPSHPLRLLLLPSIFPSIRVRDGYLLVIIIIIIRC